MKRKRVASTAVISIGYNPQARILEVEFEGGAVYCYFNVSQKIYHTVMKADSIGRAVNYLIKPRFPYKKI